MHSQGVVVNDKQSISRRKSDHHQKREYSTFRGSNLRDLYRKLSKPGPSALALVMWLEVGDDTIAIPGVVPVGRGAAADALGWSADDFDRTFAELDGIALADWDARLMVLPEKLRRDESAPVSLTATVRYRKAFNELPECDLKDLVGAAVLALVKQRAATSESPSSWLAAWKTGTVPKRFKASHEATGEPQGEPPLVASEETSGVQEQEQKQEQKQTQRSRSQSAAPPKSAWMGKRSGFILWDWMLADIDMRLGPDKRARFDVWAFMDRMDAEISEKGAADPWRHVLYRLMAEAGLQRPSLTGRERPSVVPTAEETRKRFEREAAERAPHRTATTIRQHAADQGGAQ